MRRILQCALFSLLCAASTSQTIAVPVWANQVDVIAQKTLARPVAGISIAIAQNGRIVFARGYGFANVEHAVPVTPDTVFHIASISKNIESGVILQLVEQGKVNLDDEVTRYVPEAPVQGRRVTLRQLLNHTSGIYSFTSLPNALDNERLDLTHEQVLQLIKDKPFYFDPGSSWRYDNSAFYLAGMVVETVTGKDYAGYVRGHIFQPLAMTSSQLCDAHMLVPHLASGYEPEHGKLVPAALISWRLPFAAGAVCATASDLVRWETALDEARVLAPSSVALMRTPTTLPDGTKVDYGLGTRLGALDGHRVAGHTGSGGGFTAVLESFPDDHLTIAVLVNTAEGSATSIAASIARTIFATTRKPLRDLPVPGDELRAISGRYDSDAGSVELYARDDRIRFRIPEVPEGGPMFRQSENAYAIDENIEIRFVIRGGHAQWTFVYAGGLMLDAKLAQGKEH